MSESLDAVAAPTFGPADLLAGLERQFFDDLNRKDGHPSDRDYNASKILPAVLLQAERVPGDDRGMSSAGLQARKAAQLLPLVPQYIPEEKELGKDGVDFLKTRTILWEALMTGLMEGWMYAKFNSEAATALLKKVPLSSRERAALKEILRKRFEAIANYHHTEAARKVLALAEPDSENEVIRSALHSIATNGHMHDLMPICTLFKEIAK